MIGSGKLSIELCFLSIHGLSRQEWRITYNKSMSPKLNSIFSGEFRNESKSKPSAKISKGATESEKCFARYLQPKVG